jgi:hypothetical protein
MRSSLALSIGAACVLLASVSHAGPQDYPRLSMYGGAYGGNYPLTIGSPDGPLNLVAIDAESRYHELIIEPMHITPYRPDIIAALRQRNPSIKLYAYLVGAFVGPMTVPDSTVFYTTRYRAVVRDNGGFLYDQAGNEFFCNVNYAKRVNGRYVIAEAVADFFYDAVARTGDWDGIFLDSFCNSILWMETPTRKIDYLRAGYTTLAAFDAAWLAGTDTLTNRLRRLTGSNFTLIGNCGRGTKYLSCNGWMRENFPFQNGGTWYDNMYNDPGGYLVDEERFLKPTHNYLFTAASPPTDPYSSTNLRKLRFGLGSAALGSGLGVFGPSNINQRQYPYFDWWYDEYAVDLTTGHSSTQIAYTGWLGQPLAAYYQMIWPGTGPDAVTNPNFETDVTTGWQWTVNDGVGTFTRDATTAAVGSASAHVRMTTAGQFDYSALMTTTGRLSMVVGQNYSATFWAKASTPRTITVAAGNLGSSGIASRAIDIGTTWKQYQAVLTPFASGTVSLQFLVGKNAGDIWFDDVHMQAGVFGVYRRDFQNGIVLVNPSATSQTAPLERQFRKITGTVDPVTNSGQIVSQVTLAPSDALFLIGDDRIPPAPIGDLAPTPP